MNSNKSCTDCSTSLTLYNKVVGKNICSACSRKNDPKQEIPKLLGYVWFITTGITTLFYSLSLSNRIYLIHSYGWTRYTNESLRFIKTGNGHPWIVSNGDTLTPGFGHFLIGVGIWLPMCCSLLFIFYKLIGHRHLFHERGV